jgi:putative ABC transport system permease protein
VLGFAGGILGLFFGWGSLRLLSMLPQTASIVSSSLDAGHLLKALGLSILSGILAGAYPAWRGSHLSPVEAIRHD